MDSGINKPFDRIAKELAEEAPRVFLRLLGIAPPGAEVKLQLLRPETAPSVVMPDYVASLQIDGGEPCILHVEFFLRYRNESPAAMARYGGSLAWQYGKPVRSIMLLMKDEGCPGELPETGVHSIGETRITHVFRPVRLWDLDPEPVLSAEDPGLLPWALVMRLGREEAYRLGAKVGQTKNDHWIARFLELGGIRYDRSELERMLGGLRMSLEEVLVEGSSIFIHARETAVKRAVEVGREKGLAEGLAEGLEQGLAQGLAQGARRILDLALTRRFPGLESLPELNQVVRIDDLEALLIDHLMQTTDRDAMIRAIREAASKA